MEAKKLVLSVITVIIFVILCTQIKVHKNVVGEEIDYDKTWEQTAEKFPILNTCPKFASKIDYWRTQTLPAVAGYTGVNVSFKEVKNSKEMAEDIKSQFIAAGFELREEYDNADKVKPYQTVKHQIELRKEDAAPGLKLDIRIEYFDLKYPLSHNVTVLIFARNP